MDERPVSAGEDTCHVLAAGLRLAPRCLRLPVAGR